MKKISYTLLLLLILPQIKAEYHKEVGLLLGMNLINIAEKDPGLEGDNIQEAENVSFSALSVSGYYKFLPMRNSSFYATASFPIALISTQDSYFSAGIGYEYYFSKSSHFYTKDTEGLKLSLLSKLRYFALAELAISYSAYTTSVSKKTDTFIEFKGGGGLSYAITKDICLRSTVSVGFGAGLASNPMIIEVLAGGTIFLPN